MAHFRTVRIGLLCFLGLCTGMLGAVAPAFSQSVDQAFFAGIADNSGNPVELDSLDKVNLISWMYSHLHKDGIRVTQKNFPFLLSAALRNMYLEASESYIDVGQEVFDYVKSNPGSSVWGLCGTSVDFLLRSFALFGISARPISLFNTPSDGHVAIEFFSDIFHKYVYYDPLYGAYVVSSQGVPASIDDIQEDIAEFGFSYQNWRLRPLKIYGVDTSVPRSAVSAVYRAYDEINYAWGLLRNYFLFVAIRRIDGTFESRQLAGETEGIFGRWTVYDNTEIGGISPEYASRYKQELIQVFDPRYNGRYFLHFMKGASK